MGGVELGLRLVVVVVTPVTVAVTPSTAMQMAVLVKCTAQTERETVNNIIIDYLWRPIS